MFSGVALLVVGSFSVGARRWFGHGDVAESLRGSSRFGVTEHTAVTLESIHVARGAAAYVRARSDSRSGFW